MKFTKRFAVILIALSMIFSMNAFALDFPDVTANDSNKEAIDVLSSLGIIKGYEDGQFKPDKEVTRAELTSLLMRLLNLSITGTTVTDSGYIDVANNHWAVYDIKTASSMGIIKGFGDGNFGPEQSVTFEQAVKMVVAMLGYEQQAISYGGWPDGYLRSARELNILRKAEMTQTNPAPRKIIAQILYNSLEVDLMVRKNTTNPDAEPTYEINRGKNVMTEYMKLEKITGTVVANSKTRFDAGESTLLDDEIEIEVNNQNYKFKVNNNENAKSMLGLSVVAYVKDDINKVNKEIQFIKTQAEVTELTINAEDIANFTKSRLTYEKEDSEKTYNVNINDPIVIYNGKYIDTDYAFANKLVEPEIGTVTLVDSGSGYNLIKVESYRNYLVKTIDTSANKIYVDQTLASDGISYLDVPLDDIFDYDIKITKGGSNFSFSSLRKGHIISVRKSDDTQVGIKLIEILVSDAKKTGKINEIDENYITIDSTKYSLAKSMQDNDQIKLGASGNFYLDAFNKIAYVEFNAGDVYRYGYIIKAARTTSAGEVTGQIKLYDHSSGIKTYTLNSKVKVDNETLSDHDTVISKLEDSALLTNKGDDATNTTYTQPIKYLLNNSGYISEINTLDSSDGDNIFTVNENSYCENAVYNSTNKYFSNGSTIVAKIDTKTIIFMVPNDRTEEKGYSIKTYSYFTNNTPYSFEVVEKDTNDIAKVIVLYGTNLDADVHYKSPIVVVKDIKQVSEAGEIKTKLVGYDFTTGNDTEYYVEYESNLEYVEKGDVIRFGLNSDGEVNDKVYIYLDVNGGTPDETNTSKYKDPTRYPFRKVFMVSNLTSSYSNKTSITNLNDLYAFIYGTPVSALVNDSRSITLTDSVPDGTGALPTDKETTILNVANNVTFFTYDSSISNEDNRLNVIKSSDSSVDRDALVLDINTFEDVGADCDNIFVYVIDESLKTVYIIK